MTRDRKMRIAAIALAVGAAIGFGSVRASARPHEGGGGMCGPHGAMLDRLERGVGTLGLQQKDLDAIYQLIDNARRERRPLDAQLRTAHQQMRTLLDSDSPSVDAVTAQADTIGSLSTQLRKIDLRTAVQVRSMLTPDQRKQLGGSGMHGRFAHGGPPASQEF
jgi:Spy/CpxP family protein refolding chaperone